MTRIFRCIVIAGGILLLSISVLFSQTAWRGTVSTAWETAGNWSAGVPTATSTVTIGDVNYTNQPTISSAATIATLTFNSARACTLTIGAGGSLTVTGNVSGTWTANQTHLISVGAQTMNVNGTLTMGSTTSNRYRLNVTTTTGTVTVGGALVLNTGSTLTIGVGGNVYVTGNFSGAGTLTFSGAGNLYLAGNNTTTGTFNRGTGTVTYNGTGAQTVRATTYYNLTINKTAGTATLAGNTTVNTGTLNLAQGTLSVGASTLTISGNNSNLIVNGTISGTGGITLSATNQNISGTGSITSTGTLTLSTGAKTILAGTNLTIAGRITIGSAMTAITVTNNGTITSTQTANGITAANAASTWVNAANSTLNVAGPLLTTGTLTANANPNTVNYNGTAGAQTVKATTYYNLIITKSTQTATLAGATPVNGNLTISSGTLAASTYAMTIGGNFVNAGTFTGNTGSVTMNGTNASMSGAGTFNFYTLTITGSGVTAAANTVLTITDNLSTSGSGTFTQTSPARLVMSGAAKTISGTGIQLDSTVISGSVTTNNSLSLTGGLNVTGTFIGAAGTILTISGNGSTISGAGTITLNTLSITNNVSATTSVQINGNLSGGTLTATSGTFTFNGSPTQLSGIANLYSVVINGTRTLQLTTNSTLGIANILTLTGSLDVVNGGTPNTVAYNGTGAQSVVSTTYHNLTFSNGNTKTAAGVLTINGDLLIGTGTTFAAGANTHTVQGNWTNNGTFIASTSTVQLTGSNDATIGGSSVTTFSTLTVNKNASTNIITGNVNINVATLNVTNGNIAMGANNITITSTRTGNGIITGTITHTHAFSNGTVYSFEGPNNTVTFSTIGSVSSVSITVTIGSVSDFPFNGSINRQYNITVTGSGYTATLRLHYLDGELNGNVESTMQLWRYNGSTWNVSGKTANDVTNNWVEQSSLTDITNRWTISDDQNVVRWNGGTNAWNTASNWTAVQGSPSTPPSTNDIAQIGTAAFTNQPTISSSVTVKNIIFGSAQAAILTIGSGGSLTVSGINGQWSANATHTLDVSGQTLTVNGNIVLSDGTTGHAINLNVGTGTANIAGSLTESGGANITLGSGNINIAGDFNYINGTFTGGAGTFTYNGSTDQSIGGVTYFNLTVNKSAGTANLNNSTTANGNLTLSTGGTLAVNAALNVGGNIDIGASSSLNGNTNTIAIGGNWTRTGTFTPGTSTVVFNGSGTQSIGVTTFNNVVINKSSGVASPSGVLTINGNLTDSTGTLDLGNQNADRSALGGVFRMGASTLLRLSGVNNFPSNYSTSSLDATSTVEFYGTGAQTVPGSITYGNLTINNSAATATLGGSITTGGNVLIQTSGSLNSSSFTLIDQGNWTNNGSFSASTGTIQVSGSGKTLSGSSSTTFNNLTVSGSYTSSKDITTNGTLTITGTYSAGSTTITIVGDLSNTGTFTSSGIVTYSGAQVQNIAMNSGFSSTGTVNFNGTVAPVFSGSSPPQFTTLNINNTGGISPTTGWTINGVFTVASGATFNGGSATQTFNGTFTNNGSITSSGTLLYTPTGSTTITLSGTSFSSSGTVEFGGSGLLTIIGSSPTINILTISNTNVSGATLPAAWTIGGDLNITTNAILNGSSYNYSLNGSFLNNGTFNGQSSTITMTGIGEAISGTGTTFNNLVIATGATIDANSGFNISGNFTENDTLNTRGQNITFTGNTPSTISGTLNPITLDVLTISKTSATTTLAQNINGMNLIDISSGTFDISSYSVSEDAGLGTIQIDAGASLRIGGTNTLPAFTIYSFDPASTVEYYSNSAQTISASATYGGLLLSGSGAKAMNTSLTANGDLTISSGTPVNISGNITLTVNGSWQNSGTFSAGTGTVQFGGTAKSISGSTIFNNLTINGTETNAGSITVNSSLSGSGGLTQGTNSSLTINSTMSVTSFDATASGNSVTYGGTNNQSILTTTYNDLVASNSGTKTASSSFVINGDLTINLGSNLTINTGVTLQVFGKVTTAGSLNNSGKLLISD